jgi:hypothetical protein
MVSKYSYVLFKFSNIILILLLLKMISKIKLRIKILSINKINNKKIYS